MRDQSEVAAAAGRASREELEVERREVELGGLGDDGKEVEDRMLGGEELEEEEGRSPSGRPRALAD